VDAVIADPAVRDWIARVAPGARVAECTVSPLTGGSVARSVEQLTLDLADGRGRLELVRKDAPAFEIAGLRAAQRARGPNASALPELVACGPDWLITPLAPGSPLDWGEPVPENLFDSLAALHARYQGGSGLPAVIPRIDVAWWASLCQGWVSPRLTEYAVRHPADTTARARALIRRAATLPAVSALLARLPATLLHGDVHPGNVLVDGDRATLIDWGSCRVGAAAAR
jgi:hypothetical protein